MLNMLYKFRNKLYFVENMAISIKVLWIVYENSRKFPLLLQGKDRYSLWTSQSNGSQSVALKPGALALSGNLLEKQLETFYPLPIPLHCSSADHGNHHSIPVSRNLIYLGTSYK